PQRRAHRHSGRHAGLARRGGAPSSAIRDQPSWPVPASRGRPGQLPAGVDSVHGGPCRYRDGSFDAFVEHRFTTRRGDVMSATVLYMSMSFDGFIAGPNETPANG